MNENLNFYMSQSSEILLSRNREEPKIPDIEIVSNVAESLEFRDSSIEERTESPLMIKESIGDVKYKVEWRSGLIFDDVDENVERFLNVYEIEQENSILIGRLKLNDYYVFSEQCVEFFQYEGDTYFTCNTEHGTLSLYLIKDHKVQLVRKSDEFDMFHDKIVYRNDVYFICVEWFWSPIYFLAIYNVVDFIKTEKYQPIMIPFERGVKPFDEVLKLTDDGRLLIKYQSADTCKLKDSSEFRNSSIKEYYELTEFYYKYVKIADKSRDEQLLNLFNAHFKWF